MTKIDTGTSAWDFPSSTKPSPASGPSPAPRQLHKNRRLSSREWYDLYREWDSKVLVTTDMYVTVASLVIGVCATNSARRLNANNLLAFSNPLVGTLLVAHLLVNRLAPVFYKKKREAILATLRVFTVVIILWGWATSDKRRGITRQVLISTRLCFGVFANIGWQLPPKMSFVVQMFSFVSLRLTLYTTQHAVPHLLCSPMAICYPIVAAASTAAATTMTTTKPTEEVSEVLLAISSSSLINGGWLARLVNAAARGVSSTYPSSEEQEPIATAAAAPLVGFSYTFRGFIFDALLIVVVPIAVLWIKEKHSKLLFHSEVNRLWAQNKNSVVARLRQPFIRSEQKPDTARALRVGGGLGVGVGGRRMGGLNSLGRERYHHSFMSPRLEEIGYQRELLRYAVVPRDSPRDRDSGGEKRETGGDDARRRNNVVNLRR